MLLPVRHIFLLVRLLLSFSLRSVPSLLLLPQFTVCYLLSAIQLNFSEKVYKYLQCGSGWHPNWMVSNAGGWNMKTKLNETLKSAQWLGTPRAPVSAVKVMILLSTHVLLLILPKIAAIKRNFTTSAKSVIEPNKTGIAASVHH